MPTHRCPEQHLDLGDITLCATQTDDEIIRSLSTLTWTGNSTFGFVTGGQLGSLASDVRQGRISLPGRNSSRSYELVQQAIGLALEGGGTTLVDHLWDRIGPGLRQLRPVLILTAIMFSLFALFSVFHEDLLALTPDSCGDPRQAAITEAVLPLLGAVATHAIPGILICVAVALFLGPFILLFSLLQRAAHRSRAFRRTSAKRSTR